MAEQAWRPRPRVKQTGGPGRPGFPSRLQTNGLLRKKARTVPPLPLPGAAYHRAAASPALAICSGRTGVELNSILNGASASDTALAITTGGEIALPSPTPLTPSGLSGEGEC